MHAAPDQSYQRWPARRLCGSLASALNWLREPGSGVATPDAPQPAGQAKINHQRTKINVQAWPTDSGLVAVEARSPLNSRYEEKPTFLCAVLWLLVGNGTRVRDTSDHVEEGRLMIGGLGDPADDGLGDQGVEDLVEQMLGSPGPLAIVWSELSPVEAERTWVDLGRWVRWLGARYEIDGHELPPCWWRHGALVEELTALWGSWRVAYGEGQSVAAMADWHRIFHEARLRLREWAARTGCSAHDHRGGTIPPWVADRYDEWLREFTAARGSDRGDDTVDPT